jgi:cytosine deaminase
LAVRLINARRVDGTVVDVEIVGDEIRAVIGPTAMQTSGASLHDQSLEVVDLSGYLLVPSFVEPHAHLDKALTVTRSRRIANDALSAFNEMRGIALNFDHDDIVARAEEALRIYLSYGTTTIRSHVNVGAEFGMRTLTALVEVRERWRTVVDLELAALVTLPLENEGARVLRQALREGADVAGGCPEWDPDPIRAIDGYLDIAAEFGVPVDLHTDETLDASVLTLEALADAVSRSGFQNQVTASHCVSLGVQPLDAQQRVTEKVVEAGVAVVTLPQTNLYLQARGHQVAPPRGLTAIRTLRRAGVTVAAGGDNLRDVFNPVGRGDALEIGALLVIAGHLEASEAMDSITGAGRAIMRRPTVEIAAGSRADLVAVRAADLNEALATTTPDRIVWKGGRQISRTTVVRETQSPGLA